MIGKIFVPPFGSGMEKVAVIGEQPAMTEVKLMRPFVGPSGSILDSCAKSTGFPQAFLHNAIPYFGTLQPYISTTKTSETWTEEGLECVLQLITTLERTDVTHILACGNIALKALTTHLTDPSSGMWGVTKHWSNIIEHGRWTIIPTFHPSNALPDKDMFYTFWCIQHSMHRLKLSLDGSLAMDEKETKLYLNPTYEECMTFLKRCLKEGLEGDDVGFDIETAPPGATNMQMTYISLSLTDEAICIPLIRREGISVYNYWSIQEERTIFDWLRVVLENPKIRKIVQYAIFDYTVTFRLYGIEIKNLFCTATAQNLIAGMMPKDLGFLVNYYTTHPYHKSLGKRVRAGYLGKELEDQEYSARDALVLQNIARRQEGILEKQNNLEAFSLNMSIFPTLLYMEERGTKIDIRRFRKVQSAFASEAKALEKEIVAETGIENIRSPQQVLYYFKSRGAQIPESRKTHAESMDRAALVKLAKDYPIANKLLRYRKISKLLSTYFVDEKIDSDGRIRAGYSPCGTILSRLSSSENPFGTGMNAQNWPHQALDCFIPDEGYVYICGDYSQIENRIVAYWSDCLTMIAAFERDFDVHGLTASMLMAHICGKTLPIEEIKKQDDAGVLCGIKGLQYTWRSLGKRSNHSLNYDMTWVGLMHLLDCSAALSKQVLNAYHSGYPEIRSNFHNPIKQSVQTTRAVHTLLGRRINLHGRLDESLYRLAYAAIPQGTCGEMINMFALKPLQNEEIFESVEVLNQVHDHVGFQVPLKIGWNKIAEILMTLNDRMTTKLTVPHTGKTFHVPVDFVLGLSLQKEKGKKIKTTTTVEKLANKLSEDYETLLEIRKKEDKEME